VTQAAPRSGRTYRNRTFRDLALDGPLEGATFHDCVFDRCDLHAARFVDCRFVDTDFLTCDLALADVRGSAFLGVTIENAQVTGINWSTAFCDANHRLEVDFKDSVLSFSRFERLDLHARRIEGCTVHEALFDRCALNDASFRRSDLAGTQFLACDLSGADLRKARGYRIDVRDNVVVGLLAWMPEAAGLLHGSGVVVEEPPAD
jgi:fluoroquinolone resistance protein